MKKYMLLVIDLIILIIIMSTFIILFRPDELLEENDDNIEIIATLFPQYDFAKHIVGDKATVKLLIKSGVETHNFEPTQKDMININNSDLFLYTGEELEPWTAEISKTITSDLKFVNISKNIDLIDIHEFEEKYENKNIIKDNHEEEHEEEHSRDAHIWLNPKNAVIMIDNILEEIIIIDKENEEFYRKNAEEYKKEILKLDEKIEEIVENAEMNELAFGGEFAYSYFISRYNLNFVSVYTNCGHGEDPSIARVKSVIDYINKNNIPIVFYEELSEGTVAKMIAEETNTKPLVLYTIHNANTEGENPDTYVSLMEKNLENLKKALYK